MATRPKAQEGAAAPSNVVRLPTAARRQVQQRWNKTTRALAEELRRDARLPAKFIAPYIRRQMETAELVLSIEKTPALCIAFAVFEALDDKTRSKARTILKIMGVSNPNARAAAELLETRNLGDRMALNSAMDLVREGWEP